MDEGNSSGIDPFRRLLFQISDELPKDELDRIMFVYKFPDARQSNIIKGVDMFRYLEQTNVINKGKTGELKSLVKIVRDQGKKRRLREFIKKYEEQVKDADADNVSSSSYSSGDSTSTVLGRSVSAQGEAEGKRMRIYCSMDCCCSRCHGCSITEPHFCYCIMITFYIVVILLAAVFWFTDITPNVYEYLNSDKDRKGAGVIVLCLFGGILPASLMVCLLIKYGRRIRRWHHNKRPQNHERHRKSSSSREDIGPSGLSNDGLYGMESFDSKKTSEIGLVQN